jgi:hypothetical protein
MAESVLYSQIPIDNTPEQAQHDLLSLYYGYSDDAQEAEPPQELFKNNQNINQNDLQLYFTERGLYQ